MQREDDSGRRRYKKVVMSNYRRKIIHLVCQKELKESCLICMNFMQKFPKENMDDTIGRRRKRKRKKEHSKIYLCTPLLWHKDGNLSEFNKSGSQGSNQISTAISVNSTNQVHKTQIDHIKIFSPSIMSDHTLDQSINIKGSSHIVVGP